MYRGRFIGQNWHLKHGQSRLNWSHGKSETDHALLLIIIIIIIIVIVIVIRTTTTLIIFMHFQ